MAEAVKGSTPEFEKHMLELGRLCVAWAYIDRLLNSTVQEILGISRGQAASIGTEASNVASRCRLLKLLAAETDLPADWRKLFLSLLDRLGKQGELRNRYVHDYWTVAEGKLEKIDRRARAHRFQAHEPHTLVFDMRETVPTEAIRSLGKDITLTALCLHTANEDLEAWSRGEPLSESLLQQWMGMDWDRDHPDSNTVQPKRRE